MGAPSLCEVLIGMRTMRRGELLSSKCSNTQRHGGVGDQHCGQDEDSSGQRGSRQTSGSTTRWLIVLGFGSIGVFYVGMSVRSAGPLFLAPCPSSTS